MDEIPPTTGRTSVALRVRAPSLDEVEELVTAARGAARRAGLRRKDPDDAVRRVRGAKAPQAE